MLVQCTTRLRTGGDYGPVVWFELVSNGIAWRAAAASDASRPTSPWETLDALRVAVQLWGLDATDCHLWTGLRRVGTIHAPPTPSLVWPGLSRLTSVITAEPPTVHDMAWLCVSVTMGFLRLRSRPDTTCSHWWQFVLRHLTGHDIPRAEVLRDTVIGDRSLTAFDLEASLKHQEFLAQFTAPAVVVPLLGDVATEWHDGDALDETPASAVPDPMYTGPSAAADISSVRAVAEKLVADELAAAMAASLVSSEHDEIARRFALWTRLRGEALLVRFAGLADQDARCPLCFEPYEDVAWIAQPCGHMSYCARCGVDMPWPDACFRCGADNVKHTRDES